MKKKIVVISIIISVLLIGIVSASLLDFFGKITGSVEVKGPVFYASSIEIPESENARELWINKIPDDSSTNFTDGDFRAFETTALEVTKFYPAKYSFYVRAHINDISLPSQQLKLELYLYDTDTGKIKENNTCQEYITIDSVEYKDYFILCENDGLSLNPQDGLYWKMTGFNVDKDIRFYMKLGETTRMEVDKA